jgi:hypothetical protein
MGRVQLRVPDVAPTPVTVRFVGGSGRTGSVATSTGAERGPAPEEFQANTVTQYVEFGRRSPTTYWETTPTEADQVAPMQPVVTSSVSLTSDPGGFVQPTQMESLDWA